MSRATKNSSTSKDDESPILPVNLVPGLNSGTTVFTLTEDQIAERARLEADFFKEEMAQRVPLRKLRFSKITPTSHSPVVPLLLIILQPAISHLPRAQALLSLPIAPRPSSKSAKRNW